MLVFSTLITLEMATTCTLGQDKEWQETLVVEGKSQSFGKTFAANIGSSHNFPFPLSFFSTSSWHEPVSSGVTSRAESPGGTAAPYPQVG